MVEKNYAVILNSTEVENVIVLDEALAAEWFADDSTRELVEDTGQSQIHKGGTYDRAKVVRSRFAPPVVVSSRIDELRDLIRDRTATSDDVLEYLEIRDGLA